MDRALTPFIQQDLKKKMVFLTGPRQAGKTTLAQQLAKAYHQPQILNWDVIADQRVIQQQSWRPDAPLLVFDELHKMADWRTWLKGVYDGKPSHQSLLVTGSARLDADCDNNRHGNRQAGESLAGRYFSWHLNPVTVSELVSVTDVDAEHALTALLIRGGFPEPLLAELDTDADRWRRLYLEGLIRDDILEFSKIHEVRAMRLFVEMLRARVGSTLSLASMARDLQVSHTTLMRYLEILEALHIVFIIRPYHHNIARAILKEPKVYFYDTGLVLGDQGARFENATATMLLAHIRFQQDAHGKTIGLHFIRNKQHKEIDFVLTENHEITHLIEAKHQDARIPRYLAQLAQQFPRARSLLLVRHLRQPEQRGNVQIEPAAPWLAELSPR
ncbi:MAG TPA: ATP-binding protein [Wenzhouxiangella sp.]